MGGNTRHLRTSHLLDTASQLLAAVLVRHRRGRDRLAAALTHLGCCHSTLQRLGMPILRQHRSTRSGSDTLLRSECTVPPDNRRPIRSPIQHGRSPNRYTDTGRLDRNANPAEAHKTSVLGTAWRDQELEFRHKRSDSCHVRHYKLSQPRLDSLGDMHPARSSGFHRNRTENKGHRRGTV